MKTIQYIEKTSFADPAPVADNSPPVTVIPTPPVPVSSVSLAVFAQIFNGKVLQFTVRVSNKVSSPFVVSVQLYAVRVADGVTDRYTQSLSFDANMIINSYTFTPPSRTFNPVNDYGSITATILSVTPNPAGGSTLTF